MSTQQSDSDPGYAGTASSEGTLHLSIEPWVSDGSLQQDIRPYHEGRLHDFTSASLTREPQCRTLDDGSVVCTYNSCGSQFRRRWDLTRHHRAVHLRAGIFVCGSTGCIRATKGFPRKDKRDEHERNVHGMNNN